MSRFKLFRSAVCAALCLLGANAANANLESRLSGQAVYDTDLNITWLTNADLRATNTFGVPLEYGWGISSWNTAQSWISAMNAASYLGLNDWRLPTVSPVNPSGLNYTFSYDGSTDVGYNITSKNSEMAYLWVVELGNKGVLDTSGSPQSGWGPINTGPFTNLRWGAYWSGTESALGTYDWPNPSAPYQSGNFAWSFHVDFGNQAAFPKEWPLYAMVVRDGDVSPPPVNAIPEPESYAMLLAGLGVLGLAARRRKLKEAVLANPPRQSVTEEGL